MKKKNLLDTQLIYLLKLSLKEDIGRGDVTSNLLIPKNSKSIAHIIAREDAIVCGIPIAKKLFKLIDDSIKFKAHKSDGDTITAYEIIATITGSTKSILKGERIALNFLQRLSGIATLTHQFVEAIYPAKTKILDTRKTTPLWRKLEK